jgi:hypothetical protein
VGPVRAEPRVPPGPDPLDTLTTTPALTAQSEKRGWVVINMKKDWEQIFAFE